MKIQPPNSKWTVTGLEGPYVALSDKEEWVRVSLSRWPDGWEGGVAPVGDYDQASVLTRTDDAPAIGDVFEMRLVKADE